MSRPSSQVLQAVVTNDDFSPFDHRLPGGRHPVSADDYDMDAASRMQQRLVTGFGWIIALVHDSWRAAVRAAVTAQHDTDPATPSGQLPGEPGGHRCLARAANGNIPDDDDWHVEPMHA